MKTTTTYKFALLRTANAEELRRGRDLFAAAVTFVEQYAGMNDITFKHVSRSESARATAQLLANVVSSTSVASWNYWQSADDLAARIIRTCRRGQTFVIVCPQPTLETLLAQARVPEGIVANKGHFTPYLFELTVTRTFRRTTYSLKCVG